MAYNVLVMALKSVCPYRTGNLERNGIRVKIDNGTMCVVVGHETSKLLGEYAVYTNEPWISPKWNGKQNPNQGWIERGIEKALPLIKQVYQGMTADKPRKLYAFAYPRLPQIITRQVPVIRCSPLKGLFPDVHSDEFRGRSRFRFRLLLFRAFFGRRSFGQLPARLFAVNRYIMVEIDMIFFTHYFTKVSV